MELLTPDILAVFSGALIGLTLGLIGGGGSILAVPLLVYVVGIGSTHLAIGTSAFAVAVNAAFGLAMHARAHTVKWPCASVFAGAGIAGAALGAWAGKMVDGDMLLALFGLLSACDGGGDPVEQALRDTSAAHQAAAARTTEQMQAAGHAGHDTGGPTPGDRAFTASEAEMHRKMAAASGQTIDQAYVRNTPVLRTVMTAEDGSSAEIIDFAPRHPKHSRTYRDRKSVV